MRLLWIFLLNSWILLWAVLLLPFRAWRRRRTVNFVRLKISGDVPYRRGLTPGRRWPWARAVDAARVPSLEVLDEQLRALAADRQVKGILLEVDHLSMPPAKLSALHVALGTFRAKGKQVIGRAIGTAGNVEYEALCASDRILFSKHGRLELVGFSAEATTLGAGLERIGITPQFVRRGDYKTAPELFTHSAVSPAQRETVEALLDERFAALCGRLEAGRKQPPEAARRAIDEGPYSARRALTQGLCDALVEGPEVAAFLEPDAAPKEPDPERDDESPSVPSYGAYARRRLWPADRFRPFRRAPSLAVVPLAGLILEGEGGAVPGLRGPVAGSESVVRALKSAGRDRRCAAVMLYVGSPGGSATASEIIFEEVRRLAKRKPVVAYVDRVAASGGYLAAMGVQELWCDPLAVIGSIGVYAGKFDLSRLLERLGVHREVFTRGEQSARTSFSRPFNSKERASLEAEVEEIYGDFLRTVADARKRTVEEIRGHAEGRVFSGRRAHALGLVNRLGTFEEAGRRAMELAQKASGRFELVLHRPGGGRFGLSALLRQAAQAHVYALWDPGWTFSGLAS